jgi:hypothetical protein
MLKNIMFVLLVLLCGAAAIVVGFYPYIFAKTVYGVMLSVEKVGPNTIVAKDRTLAFSYAIAIRESKTGTIYTASSEDRQWGAWEKISEGKEKTFCAEARIYPYEPWYLKKAGTYHDARLLKVEDCKP